MQDSLAQVQWDLAAKAKVPLIGYFFISTALYSGVDIFYYDSWGLYLFSSMLVWVLGYVLLFLLLRHSAQEGEKPPKGSISSYFALGIIVGLAIMVGLVALILPGLYLMLRWLPAYARAADSGLGSSEAMGWSWQGTARIQKPLAFALIGPVLANVAAFGIAAFQEFQFDNLSLELYSLTSIALNAAVSIAIAWLQLLGVAAFRIIERG